MIVPTTASCVGGYGDQGTTKRYWKTYPYHPPGTDIIFPTDEGSHDIHQYPIEWWYANFHLIGQTTGQEYGSFVAFYCIQSTVAEKQEVRIFSISDISAEKTYTNTQIGTLTASNDHLDLNFKCISDSYENTTQNANEFVNMNSISENQGTSTKIEYLETTMKPINQDLMKCTIQTEIAQKTTIPSNRTDDLLQYDQWYTKSNEQGLLPFQYTLVVGGNSQQDSKPMKLLVDMDCLKQPLIIGGNGFLDLGTYGFTYYYSLTKLAVTGKITIHGITEEVIGSAWIDHQWGNFINQNPPPFGLTIIYEWFSLQLNNNREMMFGEAWDRDTGEKIDKSYTGGLNLVNSGESSEFLENYTITSQEFWYDTEDYRLFSSKWRITETSKSIDLTITPIYLDQMMRVGENYPLLKQLLEKLFPGACFWEGVCKISGTISGNSVNGRAYVELTHSYDNGNNINQIPWFWT
jgi:predicted secreted hydrolase